MKGIVFNLLKTRRAGPLVSAAAAALVGSLWLPWYRFRATGGVFAISWRGGGDAWHLFAPVAIGFALIGAVALALAVAFSVGRHPPLVARRLVAVAALGGIGAATYELIAAPRA